MSGWRTVAHRGDSACWAENSEEAIRSALNKGSQWLEVDVRSTADGRPVLHHDASMARCLGVRSAVSKVDWAFFQSARHPQGERPMDLESVLDLAHLSGAGVYVELKATEPSLVQRVAGIVKHSPCRTVVSSFDLPALWSFQDHCPGHPTMALFENRWRKPWRTWEANRVTEVGISKAMAGTPLLEELVGKGWPVLVFTVNDPSAMMGLKARGATGVFCDHAGLNPA